MSKLDSTFYQQDAITVAKKLIGKTLVRKLNDGQVIKYRITETEAYYGEEDTACHARFGKTSRSAVMYEPGGYVYVYLCYGIHYILNIITGPKDHPQGVMIRAVEGYVGPGRVTKQLMIDKTLNRANLLISDLIWLEDDGYVAKYKADKRIGIDYASARDRNRKWRFIKK